MTDSVIGRHPPRNLSDHVDRFAEWIEDGTNQFAQSMLQTIGKLGSKDRVAAALRQNAYRIIHRGTVFMIATEGPDAAKRVLASVIDEVDDLDEDQVAHARFALDGMVDVATIK